MSILGIKNSLFKSKKKKEATSKAISVLGSGRCGTSMVTKAISFLGVDLGNSFIKTSKANPKGFWEQKQVVDVQKRIIKEMGGKRPFPKGWHRTNKIKPFKNELIELTNEHFADKKLWAWKDPRNCECIELWQDILDEFNTELNYIIMIRNPIDVADSFKEAYKRREQTILKLWQMRTLVSLKETHGEPRIIVDYNDFLENSMERLRDIANALNLPWPDDETELRKQLDDFIDPNLRHRQTDDEELANAEDIGDDVKELYYLCLEATKSPDMLQSKEFKAKINEMYKGFIKKHGSV